jgi:hypothetical protein
MFKHLFAVTGIAILVSSQLCATAQAAGVTQSQLDEKFYAGNSIMFYDPRCSSDTAQGYLTLAGKDNLEKILNFLMRQGLTLAQSSGVVGNLMAESGLNPAIIQGGGTAPDNYMPVNGVGFGLAQWTFTSRQQPLVKLAQQTGAPVTDLSVQMNYLWSELSGAYASTLSSLKATNDPVQAAVIFHKGYEGSADSYDKVVANRGGNAARVYQTYSDAPAIAGSTASQDMQNPGGSDSQSTSEDQVKLMAASQPAGGGASGTINGSCTSDSFSGGNISETVVAYAWPQYAMRTDQMPAYTDAVNKAKGQGLYIGGYNGNDCGAFVTLLIRNSGFDEDYNSNGRGGNTIAQEAWLAQHWDRISSTDGGNRQPGDVAINSDHTYVYVGQIGGFGSKIASASLGDRAPMAGHESAVDPSFRWYRHKADVPAGTPSTALQTTAGGGGGSF